MNKRRISWAVNLPTSSYSADTALEADDADMDKYTSDEEQDNLITFVDHATGPPAENGNRDVKMLEPTRVVKYSNSLKLAFDDNIDDRQVFYNHLHTAGIKRKVWCEKIWDHFQGQKLT